MWAYIRRNPGKGTKEMRADWDVLLPSLSGRARNGAIDRGRESLEADGRIRIEVGKFGKRAAYAVVDDLTGEMLDDWDVASVELDRLLPVERSARCVPFRRLSVVT